jgi:hypothetical protein
MDRITQYFNKKAHRKDLGKLNKAFNDVAMEGIKGPHEIYGARLMLMGKKPVMLTSEAGITKAEFKALNKAVEKGKLKSVKVPYSEITDPRFAFITSKEGHEYFYCQPDKEADMMELVNFYKQLWFGKEKGISNDMHKRIGEILGYEENDIALFLEKRYSREERKLLCNTNDIRRDMRYQKMVGSNPHR